MEVTEKERADAAECGITCQWLHTGQNRAVGSTGSDEFKRSFSMSSFGIPLITPGSISEVLRNRPLELVQNRNPRRVA